MLYYAKGGSGEQLSDADLGRGLREALECLGERKRVLAIPPDATRSHSRAGELTRVAAEYYGPRLVDVLPALGTHAPMSAPELERMFPGVSPELFREHDWRRDLVTLGQVPAALMRELSEGRLDYEWPAQVNRLLVQGGHDLILSLGQVVPHEVVGLANHSKNILIGTGGREAIDRSHYLGAVYGMERIMGRVDTPVRRLLDEAVERFAQDLPIVYALTVVATTDAGPVTRGLFVGDDRECFERASELAQEVNIHLLDRPLSKAVVYLDPAEFRTTWLGNKGIYRLRMAMADGGELVILAPGVSGFGEDPGVDRLIRKYGYVGTDRVCELVAENEDLRASLSAAAHLIHGSSEGRFRVTYAPGHLSREEVEGVNLGFEDLEALLGRYDPRRLQAGFNSVAGEDIYYVPNPGLGLWAARDGF